MIVFISIKPNQHTLAWATRLQEFVEKLLGILEVYRMAGDTDYLLKAMVPDMPGYDFLY